MFSSGNMSPWHALATQLPGAASLGFNVGSGSSLVQRISDKRVGIKMSVLLIIMF